MTASRSSYQLSGSLRKVYRSTNVYDWCWNRSLDSRSSQKNELHKFKDGKVIQSSSSPLTSEGRQNCLHVTGFFSSSIFQTSNFDMVRPIKLSALGKLMTKTSVPWINHFSRTSLRLNPKMFCSSRHFCSAEFRGDQNKTRKIKKTGDLDAGSGIQEMDKSVGEMSPNVSNCGDKAGDLIADSGIQEMGISVGEMSLNVGNHGGEQVIPNHLDIYDYSATNQDSRLPGRPLPAAPVILESYNLAPFIAKSDVLRYLLNLNVNLAKVEAKPNAASSLVKLDLEQDVMPVMFFLKEAEIPDDKLGKVIGLYPFIFEKFDQAKLVMEYFTLKKFKKESIAHIIVGAPTILGLKVVTIDTRIGAYQKFFNLTGDQTRNVMTRVPRILLNHPDVLKETIEMFRGHGFSKDQLKNILLQCPSVFKRPEQDNLKHRLQYLLTNIPMDHNTVTNFSYILRYPTNPIKERHLFLLELGRAQYDPTKENYISPTDLVCSPESKFCRLARTTPALFREFKMTL